MYRGASVTVWILDVETWQHISFFSMVYAILEKENNNMIMAASTRFEGCTITVLGSWVRELYYVEKNGLSQGPDEKMV